MIWEILLILNMPSSASRKAKRPLLLQSTRFALKEVNLDCPSAPATRSSLESLPGTYCKNLKPPFGGVNSIVVAVSDEEATRAAPSALIEIGADLRRSSHFT